MILPSVALAARFKCLETFELDTDGARLATVECNFLLMADSNGEVCLFIARLLALERTSIKGFSFSLSPSMLELAAISPTFVENFVEALAQVNVPKELGLFLMFVLVTT